MLDSKTFLARTSRRFFSSPVNSPQEFQQRRLMLLALSLLLIALITVLYHDRDFWFPDAADAENQLQRPLSAATASPRPSEKEAVGVRKSSGNAKPRLNASAQRQTALPVTTVSSRTVLPPLEIEVVAGDSHRIVRPPSNEVNVDLDSVPPQEKSDAFSQAPPASDVTTSAAERVEMSTDTSKLVSRSVEPGYPMLARQMKVQGSVILLAMISRDGAVQDLRILSGPPILATAAREAVRQWHFKPHYEGSDAVETIARVTVNFTISTN